MFTKQGSNDFQDSNLVERGQDRGSSILVGAQNEKVNGTSGGKGAIACEG